jgi:hypothetical protein
VPVLTNGGAPGNYYVAVVDQNKGTFQVAGADLKGMPPGKYQAGLQLLKKENKKVRDVFDGKYDGKFARFVFEVDSSTKELVIDLDKS